MANQYDYSYNQNKRILEIRDAQTNKVLFVPKVASGAVEDWQTTLNTDGSTKIEYHIGKMHFTHLVNGAERSTVITNPDATKTWEAEKGFHEKRFANGTKEQACLSDLGITKVREATSTAPVVTPSPITPPAPPAPQKPSPKPTPSTTPTPKPTTTSSTIVEPTPSELSAAQRATEQEKKTVSTPKPTPSTTPSPSPSPIAPSPPTKPSSVTKAEVGVSFPPPSSNTKHPNHYHFEKQDGNLILKDKDGNTLYSTPATKENESALKNPRYRNNSGWHSIVIPTQDGGRATLKVHPEAKAGEINPWAKPRVAVTEQTKKGITKKETDWKGDLNVTQTPEQGNVEKANEDATKSKESLEQWQAQLKTAQTSTSKDATKIAKLQQRVKEATSINNLRQKALKGAEISVKMADLQQKSEKSKDVSERLKIQEKLRALEKELKKLNTENKKK